MPKFEVTLEVDAAHFEAVMSAVQYALYHGDLRAEILGVVQKSPHTAGKDN